ncbi:MAG: FkbM family methyltransferase [Methanocalculaceae archaeon]|nr:FkbM family methyltransferase [Methanocalculaceae archaeon]
MTRNDRTEDFYWHQYKLFFQKFYSAREDCLRIGSLCLPRLSVSGQTTREEAYYAMEIGDILLPGIHGRLWYVDEGPYEWGDVRVSPGDVVFDCGAHMGVFSLLAAYRGARVFAFEPIAEARVMFAQTLDLNPVLRERITVVPMALGAKEGTAEFTVLADTLIGSSMVLPHQGRKVQVQVTTVDAFVGAEELSRVDFLKADIEGAERQMLKGAKETLQQCVPKVAICTYHLPDDAMIIAGLLREANPQYVLTERWKKMYGRVPAGR